MLWPVPNSILRYNDTNTGLSSSTNNGDDDKVFLLSSMMADATQPENYSDDNDPCPICLCSFDRADVSELQFPFRGPDRRRGFASERYGGQYRYSYACHIRIITRTGGRNDEKRMKKNGKKEKKSFDSSSKYSRLYRIVRLNTRAQPSRLVLKDCVRFLLWRWHIVRTNRGSIKIVPGFRWHAYIRSTPACRSIMSASEQHVVSA